MSTLTDDQLSTQVRYDEFVKQPSYRPTLASIILGGGQGSRLYPLTLNRCKPALNFGGKYCLIDIPLSHSIHSNCCNIFVLTQFLSASLHRHIFQTYFPQTKNNHQIDLLSAEQSPTNQHWFQGTADAVRKNLHYILESSADYFLILSGDQLYHLDFNKMLDYALQTNANVTIASLSINASEAARMGVMQINSDYQIQNFCEKPQDKALLQSLKCQPEILKRIGLNTNTKKCFLGSMGIYLFKRQALINLLINESGDDFGKHLIPELVRTKQASAYIYDGYWEDIGTIESFYQANLALINPKPKLNFYQAERPIFFHQSSLAPSKCINVKIKESIVCEGCLIEAEEISQSLLGPRTVLHKGVTIRKSYIMGNDFYQTAHSHAICRPQIGEGSEIHRAIIDKNVVIGKKVKLVNKQNLTTYDGPHVFIRDGIIIVPQGTVIPDGFVL